jgi:hypothetical protein
METYFIQWVIKMTALHEDFAYMFGIFSNYRDPNKIYRKKIN